MKSPSDLVPCFESAVARCAGNHHLEIPRWQGDLMVAAGLMTGCNRGKAFQLTEAGKDVLAKTGGVWPPKRTYGKA